MLDTEFKIVSSREYWVTGGGKIMYPQDFENSHLINTVIMLKRKARIHRLEEARVLCNAYYRTGNMSADINVYYDAYREYMNKFIDDDISDERWLRNNSKIFMLLMDEVRNRGLEIKEEKKSKTTFTYRSQKKERKITFDFANEIFGRWV